MSRREIREHVFRILFGAEFRERCELEEQIDLYFEQVPDDDLSAYPGLIPEEERKEIREKVLRITDVLSEIDASINDVATGWKTGRMGKADLGILRLAVYEMKYDEHIPVNVAINEAVELAKKFGSDDSASFVNGILAKLV